MKSRTWLIVETALFTLLPILLLLYSAPFIVFGSVEVLVPVADSRSLSERLLGMLPYWGAVYALVDIWRRGFRLYRGIGFELDTRLILAAIAGALATRELVVTTNAWSVVLIAGPTWLLVAHFLHLRALERKGREERAEEDQ